MRDALPAVVARGRDEHGRDRRQRCAEVIVRHGGLQLPTFTPPDGRTPDEYFETSPGRGSSGASRARRRALRGRPDEAPPEKYDERLAWEISVIEKMGFPSYFLIVWDFIQLRAGERDPGRARARERRRLARRLDAPDHRGRPAPLRPPLRAVPEPRADLDARHRHRLLRGAGAARSSSTSRKKYGRENVAQIITFNSQLKPKRAVRDVGRVLSTCRVAEVDRIAKLDARTSPTASSSDASPRLGRREGAADAPRERVVPRSSSTSPSGSRGSSRHAGVHAAGVVIAPRPIIEFLPALPERTTTRSRPSSR